MVGTEGEDEEFEFYLKFAKPLVLNLPDTNDRIKAAAWIRYLKDDQADDDVVLRGEYLKLLLFVLQRRRLYGPFSVIPKNGEPLPKFPDDINIQDVAKNFLEIDKKLLVATLEKGGYGEWPPYTVACSSDLTEYAVSQEIPGFGVHAFCAFSRDPLPAWNHFERAIFPIGENVTTTKAECPLIDTTSPDISCFVSAETTELPAPLESPRRSPRVPPDGPKTPPPDAAPDLPPKEPSSFKEDEFGMDERVPPTWGSNLVEVKDLALPKSRSPFKDFDVEVSEQDMLDFFNDDIDLYDADLDEASSYLQGDFFSPGSPKSGSPDGGICPSVGSPCPAEAGPPQTPPHYSPQLPEDYVTSPHKMFDMVHDLASDRDMLDFYYNQSPKLPEDDPAFYLQGTKLESPQRDSPPCSRTPEGRSSPGDDLRRMQEQASGIPLPLSPVKVSPVRASPPPCSPRAASPQPGPSQSSPCPGAQTPDEEEGLGGDSFMESAKKDFRWLADISQGPGLPEDEEQDPALWESFGSWTDDFQWLRDGSQGPGLPDDEEQDPGLWESFGSGIDDHDEIFQLLSPSPKERSIQEEDPYAAERKRWGEAVRTPPIFSKDPRIREGPDAQRQYTIDEFGMESFEEPVWTSAEQYLKYTRDSPFKDPRDINRKAYDPADYPKEPSPEMSRRLSEIQADPEEAAFFQERLSPDLINVTLGEEDLQPMTKVEAMMEAIRRGPHFIGLPSPSPEKTPETPKEDSGEWEDVKFIEETPPLFMLEPPFLATPPEYEPNPNIEVDELDEETVGRYIEEDLKLINAMIPVTTPQRAPSPKRPPPMTAESPPFIQDIDVEPDPYILSPGPDTPERHVVPPQKVVDWDTNIGSPIRLPETNAVVIVSETELLEQNIKRKQELAVIYERQYQSPPKIPTPPAMPHLMDDPIPGRRLPRAMSPKKLPPANWSWQTPERLQREPYVPRVKRTPTGLSPPTPIPRELTMFYESPPEDLYSPPRYDDFDMGALSPPRFTPSPPRRSPQRASPYAAPCVSYAQKDVIDRELYEPSGYDIRDVDVYFPDIELSPEPEPEPEPVEEFSQSEISDLQTQIFSAVPEAAAQHVVISPRKPSPPKKDCSCDKKTKPTKKGSSKTQPRDKDISKPSSSSRIPPKGKEKGEKQPPLRKRPSKDVTSKIDTGIRRPSKTPSDTDTKQPPKRLSKTPSETKQPPKRPSKTPSETKQPPKRLAKTPSETKQPLKRPAKGATSKTEVPSRAKPPAKGSCKGPCSTESTPSTSRTGLKPKSKSKVPPRQKVPPAQHVSPEPVIEDELEREIRQLEAELFLQSPRRLPIRPTAPDFSPPTPELQRKLWRQQLEMHEDTPYSKRSFMVQPTPGKSVRVMKYQYQPKLERIPDSLDIRPPTRTEIGPSEFELTPERRAWRERVRAHEPTAMRKKIFHIRPKYGKSKALTGAKIPQLSPVQDTSPVSRDELDRKIAELEAEVYKESQSYPSEPAVTTEDLARKVAELESVVFQEPERSPEVPCPRVQQLDEEIARMEEELRYLSTPPRRGPDYSPETPPITRDLWLESVRRFKGRPYRERTYARQPPSLPTILSPSHPDFQRWEREKYLEEVRRQAEIEVEFDKLQLTQTQEVDLQPSQQHLQRAQYEMSDAERQYWQSRRYDFQVPSPEPPEPIIIDDSPERDRGEYPEGWSWKTPEKYEQRQYVPKVRKTPTGISPPRQMPQELTMFHESPPEDLDFADFVDEDDINMDIYVPPQLSPTRRTPSPPRSPQRMVAPQRQEPSTPYWQKDAIDQELQLPFDAESLEDISLEDVPDIEISPERTPSPCPRARAPSPEPGPSVCPGDQALSPDFQALKERLRSHKREEYDEDRYRILTGEGNILTLGRQPPSLPTIPDNSPIKVSKPRAQLIREINELSRKIKSPSKKGKPFPDDPNSPPTPGQRRLIRRPLYPYPKERKRLAQRPTLDTVHSPSHPNYPELQEEQRRREFERYHQTKLEYSMRQIDAQRKDLFEHTERHKRAIAMPDPESCVSSPLREYWRTRQFDFSIESPPTPLESPQLPPHLLDDPLPEDLPQAMLPPSGWTWKTPERYIRPKYVPKEKKYPTGISPPRPIPKELTMFHESPPEELYSPEFDDDFDLSALSPPQISPRTPSTSRRPCQDVVSESYFQKDIIDRELQEPTDYDDVDLPDVPDYILSPEEPREISPERESWRQAVQKSRPLKKRAKIFYVRPRPNKAIALEGAKIPDLSPVADTSPPEAPIEEPDSVRMPAREVIEELDRQIEELEAELESLRTPPRREISADAETPPTPEYERRLWSEMVRLHERRDLPKGKRVSRQPELTTVFSPRHPDFEELEKERHFSDMRREAERVVQMDIQRLQQEQERDLHPFSEEHQERVQYEMPEEEREYWRSRRYDIPVPSPPSPEAVPEPELHPLDEPVPEGLPRGLSRPIGWSYGTPPHLKYRVPEQRKLKTPTGIPSPKLPPLGTLFYESPPFLDESLESEPYTPSPPRQLALPQPRSPLRSPGGRPIAPCIPPAANDFDVALYYDQQMGVESPPEFYSSPPEMTTEELEELSNLEAEIFGDESSPCAGPSRRRTPPQPEPLSDFDRELQELEALVYGTSSEPEPDIPSEEPRRPIRPTAPEFSPPTPEHQRKIWRHELRLHEDVPYSKKSFMIQPTPGKSVRVAKYSHRPKLPRLEEQYERSPPRSRPIPQPKPLSDFDRELQELEALVFGTSSEPEPEIPCEEPRRLPIRPTAPEFSPPTPEYQRRIWRKELELHEDKPYPKKSFSVKPKPGRSVRVAKYSHRPKLPEVEEQYYELSPVSPPLRPRPLQDIELPLPEITAPPENWTWKTPSPLTKRGIYAESPPLIYSPPDDIIDLTSPPSPRSPQRSQSPRIIKLPTPKPSTSRIKWVLPSPIRSPGGRPVLQQLDERPLDAFELAQAVPQDFDTIDLTSPCIDLTSPDYSPPAPPPRPTTPRAWIGPIRRVQQQAPLDPNVLYGRTPPSARKQYERLPESIRFEQARPVNLPPSTPEAPKGYYETPIPQATRPYRRKRKIINKQLPRKRLQFDDEVTEEYIDLEEENLKMLELEAQLLGQSPPRDMLAESPPDLSPDAELLGDLVYEPPVFNLYSDEDAPDYDVRPAFEGRPDTTLTDTSPMETIERIPMHLRGFRWMDTDDACGPGCPSQKRH